MKQKPTYYEMLATLDPKNIAKHDDPDLQIPLPHKFARFHRPNSNFLELTCAKTVF